MTASTPMWARVTNRDRGSFASFTALPESANDGDIAYIQQLVGSETIRMRYVTAISAWTIEPGQCVINAHDIFEVVSAPSAMAIIYSFPWSAGIIRPSQIWRCDIYVTGSVSGVGGPGFRTQFGTNVTINSSMTAFSQSLGRARSNKTFGTRPNGNVDTIEFDGTLGVAFNEAPNNDYRPGVIFSPGEAGASYVLRHYSLRRIG